jgi:hypothetical protein
MSETKPAREIEMPSGAKLKVWPAPFSDAKALYTAVLEEGKAIEIDRQKSVENLLKTLLLTIGSSKKVDSALEKCLEKCLYNDLKFDKNTFEPVEARADYIYVCLEAGKENLGPFASGLYGVWNHLLSMIESIQKSPERPMTT